VIKKYNTNRKIPKQEKENIELAELIGEYNDRFCHILGYLV